MEEVTLLAPNGKPSNLTSKQWHLVRTPEFKAWFGDWENDPKNASKVVDENGEPLVCYHGSRNEFNEFKINEKSRWDIFWFTPNYETAKMHAEYWELDTEGTPIVYKCFLNVRKLSKTYPFDLKKYDGFIDYKIEMDYVNWKQIKHIQIVQVVNSNQIKLADGSNTTFDSSNPDIRYEDGGEISDHEETYKKWKSLVNMSKSELENFYNSEEGKKAGLSSSEAKSLGIHSGRESARWIMKMKDTPKSEWTPTMWKWAKRQISFISRMSGNKGDLYDDKGNKTRKHTSLLIWGHNPKKHKSGGTIAQTPAPKADKVYGSKVNVEGSSKDTKSAKEIKFDAKTLLSINNKVKEHNKQHPDKKVTLATAKAVVRRGMGAYSSTHRPTISGGKPNSRVAWGLARLNAFMYKIVHGKSKSGKYSQDDDLINELGYKVKSYANGGDISDIKSFNDWFLDWYKNGVCKKMNIMISVPNQIGGLKPIKVDEDNAMILDLFEKTDLSIDAKKYMSEIVDKADQYGVTLYLQPNPRYKYIKDDNYQKKITRQYLIKYYEMFGFELMPDKEFMKRLPNLYADGGDVELLAPNGKPSNLTPEQYKLVRTTAFKKWFGDWEILGKAKQYLSDIKGIYKDVANENVELFLFEIAQQCNSSESERKGAIKAVGERLANIALNLFPNAKVGDVFSPAVSKVVDENGEPQIMWHGSNSKHTVFEVNQKGGAMGSGIYLTTDKSMAAFYGLNVYDFFVNIKNPKYVNTRKEDTQMLGGSLIYLQKKGKGIYDGICNEYNIWLAINPTQIKLADGSNTTFDSNNPDIRYDSGGIIEVVINEGNGVVINKIFNQWNSIKNEKDFDKWAKNVRGAKFGTYGTIGLLELLDRFEFKQSQKVNNIQKEDFIKEVKRVLNNYAKGGEVEADKFDKVISASSRFKPIETIYFDPPLIGKNGAKLISYTWSYEWTMLPNYEGELVSKRVSDWTQAENSADTGRDIVHKYGIEMPDGTFKSVSSESVPILLGYIDRKELKHFPNLVTAAKTLAKQQMQLAILEAQEKEYKELKDRFEKGEKPNIEEIEEPIAFVKQSWLNGEHKVFSMGDVWVRQDNRYDYNTKTYIPIKEISPSSKEMLISDWVQKRIKENGGKYPQGIYDLRNRVERQKRKVNDILKLQAKEFEQGGVLDLLAPNGKPSNLTPEQWHLVRTPEFKAWFGDWENDPANASKVVDENGEPLVVYHGSRYGGINVFDIKNSKRVSSGLKEFGSFFTTNINVAELYRNGGRYTKEADEERVKEIAKLEKLLDEVKSTREYNSIVKEIDKWYSKIYPVFLNLRKIKQFDANFGSNKEGYYNLKVDAGYKIASGNDAVEFLRDGRFGVEKVDGIRADNVVELMQKTDDWKDYIGTSFLVFNDTPQYIKLADGTNTTFDSNNPDIRYEDGGKVEKLIQLPDVQASEEALARVLEMQGYKLEKETYSKGGRTFNDAELLNKYKKGESIGFTAIAHLKSKGLIERADGTKRKSIMEQGGIFKPHKTIEQIAKEKNVSLSYAKEQLEKGIKIESEHSNSLDVQKTIALQHLDEMIDYYEKLEIMEQPKDIDKYYGSIKRSYSNGGEVDAIYTFPTPTGAYTMLKYIQQVLVRTSEFKRYFGDWELAAKNFLADNRNNFEKHYKNVSKVVNPITLEPLVVYHGSSAIKEFFEFDATAKNEEGRPYAYFADNIEYSQNFVPSFSQRLLRGDEKALLYNAFIKINNPFFALGSEFEQIRRNRHYWMQAITKKLYSDKEGNVIDERLFQNYTIATYSQLGKYFEDTFEDREFLFWNIMSRDYKKTFKTFLIVNGYDGVRYSEEFDPNNYDENNPAQFTKAWTIFDASQVKLADGRNINFDPMNKDIRFEQGGDVKQIEEVVNVDIQPQSRASDLRSKIGLNTKMDAGGFLLGKKDGKLIAHNNGDLGGIFVGKSHSEGGIDGINKATGEPIEVEGEEIQLNSKAVADSKPKEFNGKKMTNREILSYLNVEGGGKSFEQGGAIEDKLEKGAAVKNAGKGNPIEYSGGEVILTRGAVSSTKKYEYNGKMMTTREIASEMNVSNGGVSFASGGNIPQKTHNFVSDTLEKTDDAIEYVNDFINRVYG